ncbi:TIGR00730 family Rossman fold protein [Kingella potus]|nr:TIGR00730 family Rossman fold protein [Kingella potus]UOP01856.1 TIGR00730 family Rossman fold protein [Kingella potus]
MNNIAVYCGSNYGQNPACFHAARELGALIAQRGSRLIYGGGRIGLMGATADAVLQHGGSVTGVIPTFLVEKEMAHPGLTELIQTADMAARKSKMIALSDAFVALSGGIGTFEELFEVLSLSQLRLHRKPVGIVNTGGFYDPLLALLERTAAEGYMPQANLGLLCVADTPADLLEKMAAWQPQQAQNVQKWTQPAWLAAEMQRPSENAAAGVPQP